MYVYICIYIEREREGKMEYRERVPEYNDANVRYPLLSEMSYIAKHSERVSRFCSTLG